MSHHLLLSRRSGKAGFTLMELLVVLVIMGFLLGMIVPRLGGVADSAVDTVCDSNNKGVRYYTKAFLDAKNRLPNKLTNLVVYDSTGAVVTDYDNDSTNITDAMGNSFKMKSDYDADNGADMFASDFVDRNGLTAYQLNAAEAQELRDLGITTLLNLRGASRPMESVSVNATTGGTPYVAMCGDLSATALATFAADSIPDGNPFFYGRIIMGIGDESELVSSGYIQAAALCPGGIQQQDNVTFNNYAIVLPRLEATVDRITWAGTNAEVTITADNNGDGTADTDGEQRTFTIEYQEKWEFDFTCPEGHKWPDADNDEWVASQS